MAYFGLKERSYFLATNSTNQHVSDTLCGEQQLQLHVMLPCQRTRYGYTIWAWIRVSGRQLGNCNELYAQYLVERIEMCQSYCSPEGSHCRSTDNCGPAEPWVSDMVQKSVGRIAGVFKVSIWGMAGVPLNERGYLDRTWLRKRKATFCDITRPAWVFAFTVIFVDKRSHHSLRFPEWQYLDPGKRWHALCTLCDIDCQSTEYYASRLKRELPELEEKMTQVNEIYC